MALLHSGSLPANVQRTSNCTKPVLNCSPGVNLCIWIFQACGALKTGVNAYDAMTRFCRIAKLNRATITCKSNFTRETSDAVHLRCEIRGQATATSLTRRFWPILLRGFSISPTDACGWAWPVYQTTADENTPSANEVVVMLLRRRRWLSANEGERGIIWWYASALPTVSSSWDVLKT